MEVQSRPQKALLKLRDLGILRIQELPSSIQLWFVRVFKITSDLQSRPGDALAKKDVSVLRHTHAHAARPAAPSRGTRRKQTTNTHAARRQLYSQIARASHARSRERASSAGSEGAARRAVRRGAKDKEHARTANRDEGNRTSLGVPARCVRRISRRVRHVLVRGARAPPAGGLGERSEGSRSARVSRGGLRTVVSRAHGPRAPRVRGARTPHAPRVTPCAT